MRNAIKIAAVVGVIGAIAIVALAGSALAYGGNTGTGQGMMGHSNGMGMMSGQGYGQMNGHGCMNGQYTSGATQANGQVAQGYACPMYANGTTAQDVPSTPSAQTHCCGCW